jgi:hypothetical protein
VAARRRSGPGRGAQSGGGVLADGLAVAEAGDLRAESGEAPERLRGPRRVGVEHAEHGLAVGPGGDRVPGDQGPRAGQVDGGAAGGVAGGADQDGAVAEAELVAVAQLAVDPDGPRRRGRELSGDLLEDGPLPAGQVRGRPGAVAAQEGRVGVVGENLDVAPGGDVGGSARVVRVEMGEDQVTQVGWIPADSAQGGRDLRRGAVAAYGFVQVPPTESRNPSPWGQTIPMPSAVRKSLISALGAWGRRMAVLGAVSSKCR